MKLKLSLLLTLSLIIFGGTGASGADFSPIQLTSNSYDDTLPEVEGNLIVWQGHGNLSEATSTGADWEIFCYNTETKEARQITDNDYHDTSPQTDGTYVVWQGVKDGEWDIFLWDGDVHQAQLVCFPDDGPWVLAAFVIFGSNRSNFFLGDLAGQISYHCLFFCKQIVHYCAPLFWSFVNYRRIIGTQNFIIHNFVSL